MSAACPRCHWRAYFWPGLIRSAEDSTTVALDTRPPCFCVRMESWNRSHRADCCLGFSRRPLTSAEANQEFNRRVRGVPAEVAEKNPLSALLCENLCVLCG